MQKAHATLGASSSHRWMECPGSIALSEGVENKQTVFAREGSAAHAVAENCLSNDLDAEFFVGEEVEGYGSTDEFDAILVDEDMADAVQMYLDAVREEYKHAQDHNGEDDVELSVEVRFDLSHIYPEMFGTNDALIYDAKNKKLTVFDYKHGQGVPVEVERNPQLMYYALGALTGKHNRAIDKIELVIVQPRCPHRNGPIRRWETTPEDMLEFIHELVESAEKTKDPDAAFKAGDWCKFCPAAAAGICNALSEFVYTESLADFTLEGEIILSPAHTFSPEQKARLLRNAKIFETWFKGIKQGAHADALAGNPPPGFKIVESRPRRVWKSLQRVVDDLMDRGFTEKEIYAPLKLKTPAQMESYFKGKKEKKEIEYLWERKSGGTALVHEQDDRDPLRPDADDEFGDD